MLYCVPLYIIYIVNINISNNTSKMFNVHRNTKMGRWSAKIPVFSVVVYGIVQNVLKLPKILLIYFELEPDLEWSTMVWPSDQIFTGRTWKVHIPISHGWKLFTELLSFLLQIGKDFLKLGELLLLQNG